MDKFSPGEGVWFTSKFGYTVTGTYVGISDEEVPWGNGLRIVHLIDSYDAFGVMSSKPTRCIVPNGLHRVVPSSIHRKKP